MRTLLCVLVLAATAAPVGVRADEPTVARTLAYTFVPPSVSVDAGGSLALENLDRDVHTLTSLDQGPDGSPLFDTPPTGLLQTSDVAGVEDLGSGTYAFYCRIHPFLPTMYGTLEVR